MDSSDQRRKRKRSLRQPYSCSYFPLHLFSVRFFVICFIFLICLRFYSYTSSSASSAFHPVLVVSSLSLLSSSSSRAVKSVQESDILLPPLKIESRVLFPDHILLLVSGWNGNVRVSDEFECVYRKFDGFRNVNLDFGKKRVLSVDEYDGFRSIVRCPLPPMNCSNAVLLSNKIGKNVILRDKTRFLMSNYTVKSWGNVVYSASVDRDTAILFVKGLNLRPDRESDATQFSCHYGLGRWERNGRFTLSMKALTAAQEIVRCPLPMSIRNSLDRGMGVRVTVGVTSSRAHGRVLMPSVAKIYGSESSGEKRKYELCVCSMVWNQASSIREWIKYHSWLGVERWFIYDNNSDDGIDGAIQELYRDSYNVTRHVWPWIKTQEAGFSHCALRAKDECTWVSFMDVDEYFYFPNSTTLGYASQNSLRSLVANFSSSSVAEIRTSCHSFGPSGLKSRPAQGVTIGYTCRLQSPERHKSIIRPDALDPTLLNVVHHFHLRKGFEYLNLPQSTAIINHYKYQVWEVFRAKFYRRVATYVADWRENQNEGSRDRAPGLGTEAIEPPDWPQRFCEVWDTGLRDFVLANLSDLLPWETHQDH
ncbi:hypothetical protein ACS0TY_009010 [Phlomoides rotata]